MNQLPRVLRNLLPRWPCTLDAVVVSAIRRSRTEDVLQLSATDGYGFPDFASHVAALFSDGIHIDMHAQLFPEGEIR